MAARYRRRPAAPRSAPGQRSSPRTTLPSALRGSASTRRTSTGALERRQLGRRQLPERAQVGIAHDEGHHGLAPLGRGQAHDGHLDHTGVAGQDGLDLGGVDVVAAGDDQLGAAPADGHVAVVRHRHEVARGEPVAGPRRRRGPSTPGTATRRARAAPRSPARRRRRAPPPPRAAARPTEPGRRSPSSGLDRVSERLGHAVALQHRRRRRRRAGATGRRPTAPIPTRTGAARPSADACPDAASRWYMVGHAEEHGAGAARPRGPPPRRSGRTPTADAPAVRVPNSPAHRPCTWKSGSARTSRSSGSHSQAVQQRRDTRPAGRRGCAPPPSACRSSPRCRRSARRRRAGTRAGRGDGPACPATRASSSTATTAGPPANASGRSRSQMREHRCWRRRRRGRSRTRSPTG